MDLQVQDFATSSCSSSFLRGSQRVGVYCHNGFTVTVSYCHNIFTFAHYHAKTILGFPKTTRLAICPVAWLPESPGIKDNTQLLCWIVSRFPCPVASTSSNCRRNFCRWWKRRKGQNHQGKGQWKCKWLLPFICNQFIITNASESIFGFITRAEGRVQEQGPGGF